MALRVNKHNTTDDACLAAAATCPCSLGPLSRVSGGAYLSCFAQSILPQRLSLASATDTVPPGNATLPLINNAALFSVQCLVGTPGQLLAFTLSTLFPDVVGTAVPGLSSTYVPAGFIANLSLPSYYTSQGYITGPAAYEHFGFGPLTLQGQGFLNNGVGMGTVALL